MPTRVRGKEGYRLYHDSFRTYVRGHEDQVVKTAESAWVEAAVGWRKLTGDLREYVVRWGMKHLVEAGQTEKAVDLGTDAGYVEARLELGDGYGLLEDYRGLGGRVAGEAGERLRAWWRVVDRWSHLLVRAPGLLYTVGMNLRAGHPVRVGVAALGRRAYLEWVNRAEGVMEGEGPLLRVLVGHGSGVEAVAVTPDGRQAVSGSRDGTLRVWDLATGQQVALFGGDNSMTAVAAGPEGTIIAGDASGRVYILRLRT